MPTRSKKTANVIEMIPQRTVSFEKNGNRIVLLVPKLRNPFLAKYLLRYAKQPYAKIELDEFGSTVWDHIDGKRTVYEIAKILRAEHGKAVEPVFERLGLFINMLAQKQFIRLETDGNGDG